MNQSTNSIYSRIVRTMVVLVILFCLYIIYSTISVYNSTGVLSVSSADSKSVISVSQPYHQAKFIGVGNSKIRLAPGSYVVAVGDKGVVATTIAVVYKKNTTRISLNPDQRSELPSLDNINFENMSTILGDGITNGQLGALEKAFFTFKQSAKVVDVNKSSVENGPHNPNISANFTINFSVTIDSVSYKAVATYSDLTSIDLTLYNPANNSLVFDSGNIN